MTLAVLRVYWGFVGNRYVRFRNFLPLTRRQWDEIFQVFWADVLQTRKGATFSVGSKALAGLGYLAGFIGFLISAVTGLEIYSAMSQSTFAGMFAWVVPLLGGDQAVRTWHHAMLWFFAIFMLVHVYLSAFHDYVEATGTISSMFGGWKLVRGKPKGVEPDRSVPK